MDVLIARITQATGLDAATVEKAVALILQFVAKEGPQGEVNRLLDAMPGAQQAIASLGETGGGGLMGMFGGGGGVMALGAKLMALGIPMPQLQQIGRELFAYGREQAGEDTMSTLMSAIPGVSQFV